MWTWTVCVDRDGTRLGDPLFPLHFSCLFPPSPIADGGHVSAGRSLGKASWPGGSTGIGYQGTGWMFGSASFFVLGVLLLGLERKMGKSRCEVQMRVLSLDSCRERTSAEKWRKVHCTAQGQVGYGRYRCTFCACAWQSMAPASFNAWPPRDPFHIQRPQRTDGDGAGAVLFSSKFPLARPTGAGRQPIR